ncbi:MAG: hypothetical protein U5J62_05470 [Desulfurivibrio sp.]|nr:hypothetical protein [Desulfurivibrio sp.]
MAVKEQRATEFTMADPEDPRVSRAFRIIKGVPLNKVSQDELAVNVLEYWEVDARGQERRFSWVTDWELTPENAYQVMRAGRARWRIENETFNTLKNQGYNLGHNYGLGEKHLCAVFAQLMMLAFLVDQLQQLACPLFQAALQKCERKSYLWRQIRSCYDIFIAGSMTAILNAIVDDVKVHLPDET